MGTEATQDRNGNWRLAFACAAAALGVGIVITLVGTDGATGAKPDVLGQIKGAPKPACPTVEDSDGNVTRPCSATGSMTGFPTRIGNKRNPFVMPANGKIVAWSVDLSKPKKSERDFFGTLFEDKTFGTDPSARISVLRSTGKTNFFKLSKKSPAVNLSGSYGQKPVFTLDKPISAKKGTTVALTEPTWIPALALGLNAKRNQWRGSRSAGKCDDSRKNARTASPQERLKSKREYGCKFTTSRPLYNIFYVKSGSGRTQRLGVG